MFCPVSMKFSVKGPPSLPKTVRFLRLMFILKALPECRIEHQSISETAWQEAQLTDR